MISLLAKTEFSVRRVVARINHPANEWLFTEAWGVDVAVSTPRVLAALVEEAVEVGDVVRLFGLREGQANLVEVTLPERRAVRRAVRCATSTCPRTPRWSRSSAGSRVITPTPEEPLEAGDELLFVALPEAEAAIRARHRLTLDAGRLGVSCSRLAELGAMRCGAPADDQKPTPTASDVQRVAHGDAGERQPAGRVVRGRASSCTIAAGEEQRGRR